MRDYLKEIRQLEAKKDFANPRYMALLEPNFYAEHLCRIMPNPEPVSRSLGKLNQSLYVTILGPSEFGVLGKLLKWDRVADLPKLAVLILSIGGKYDTMNPEHMRMIAAKVQRGNALICPNGSHMSLYDDQQTYFTGLIKFLKLVDAGTVQPGATL